MKSTVISGVAMSQFGRFPDRTMKDLGREVIEGALADAEITKDDVQAVFFGNAMAGLAFGQECIRGETVTHPMGFSGIPVNNVENACATGANALHLAWSSVAAGQYETVIAVSGRAPLLRRSSSQYGGLHGRARRRFQRDGRWSGGDPDAIHRSLRKGRSTSHAGEPRCDWRSDWPRSQRRRMKTGSMNPRAQRRKKVSVEEVLRAEGRARAVAHLDVLADRRRRCRGRRDER